MANPQKTYFLPPSWDYHPSGPIQLGNLILSPSDPADALNGPTCPRPLPESLFPPVPKTNETWSTTTTTTQRYGIFTELLAPVLGLGANTAVDHTARGTSTFRFAESETREFAPTPDFVRACLAASPDALEVLAHARFRNPLYMVTAVKVVRGAQVEVGRVREGGVEFKVGVDATMLGAPVTLGPEVNVVRGREESAAFDAAGEFVFAFRLRKIVVRRRTGQVLRTEPFISGAMYDAERPAEVEKFVVDEEACQELSVEEGDAWETVVGDGEEVVYVRPTEKGY
ncbi:uncharacterized protein C8A04DRAFT_27544 [Dichotomopilus funicola]|uniref:Uncharacterized protein n=1 Tax=Dichotomopilus funicola TaxID=1934379 RepID=A0AAN6ZNB9_9PEZI|nr:hypothetical protein C8A04DRAFT_27544 [Dichotomopilus funicola]